MRSRAVGVDILPPGGVDVATGAVEALAVDDLAVDDLAARDATPFMSVVTAGVSRTLDGHNTSQVAVLPSVAAFRGT